MTRRVVDASFRPPWWLQGRHLQSVLPSLPLRRLAVERRAASLRAASRERQLDCGAGVRLQAFHAAPARNPRREPALAVLLHGWEGSAESLYILSLAQRLHQHGYDVVRLNLRDHGDTHHLNRELFHSCRLPEVVAAVAGLQADFPRHRLLLAGYSLGGNFMLRVAADARSACLNIAGAVAVSPVLDPAHTLDALESELWVYRRYFVEKWSRSLRRKQSVWPGVFDFEPLLRSRNLRRMTADLVLAHTEYPDLAAYLAGYALVGERLAGLAVPATIVAALDDPIIPAGDLDRLPREPRLRIVVTEQGGHCGFIESLGAGSWAERFIHAEFERQLSGDGEPAAGSAPVSTAPRASAAGRMTAAATASSAGVS
ncbi:MAG: alpha/beta fold hydrolase [Steroidobacteraceae bacterium]|nr:alpha/beta fold hydrolase [Nevskiaceae bacterium]MCP5339272.1 alpha/beta fold hydrolase [Nevskiaceae bacterium]MCP5359378.1 alpha/beta fold hydrolase [Nevskiaceae bacterium]MCP5470816.1 alpha/beta fold hydrolase [Nevskiaceae bacterium]